MGRYLIPKKPDFLRQIFNVVLAKYQDAIDPRTVTELRKLVWQAENKYKFSSFEREDPTPMLKKYFESNEILDMLRLLKNNKDVIQELLEEIRKSYGNELAEILEKRIAEVSASS